MADDLNKKADEAKKSLEEINEITDVLEDGFRSLTSRLSDIVDEIREGTSEARAFDLAYKDINRSVKSLSKITEDLIKNKIKINEKSITSKTIQDQINKKIAEQQILSTRIGSLQKQLINDINISEDERIEKEKLINQLQKNFNELAFNAIEPLQKQKEEVEAIENAIKEADKKLGAFSGVLKGIGKIPILGDLVDTKSALEAAREATDKTGSGLKGLSAGLSNLKGQMFQSLTNPANVALFVITQIGKTFLDLDKGIGEFAKGMNLSYQEAANLDQQFNSIANSSGDIAVTTKGIRDTMLAMGQAMGSNAILNAKDAETFTKLREKAGLANEELVEMQKLTLATGGNLEDNVSSMLFAAKTTALNNGVLLNEKQIMKEVAKASAATKLSLAGNPEALAKAAAQAKALGMSLEQVDKIASSLLNIESSISDELEAELLTGKNLNLEQARLYALNNDMEGLSREIAKNFGSVADFSQMNRIQQEAAAKAVGMTREELAATLTDQEALKGLSGKQAEDAKAALAAARERGMTEEEIKKQGIDGLMQQQSVQEKLNNSVEKLKELFVSLVEPLMPVLDALSSILSVVGYILKPIGLIFDFFGKIGSAISSLLGPLGTVGKILKGLAGVAIVFAAYKAFAAAAAVPIAGAILGPLAAAATLAAGFSALNKIKTADDMVSPGYGKRTLMGPEGAIALNDKDTVIAGTNLFDKKADDAVSSPGNITEFKPEGTISIPKSEKITEFKPEGAITAPTPTSSPSIDYTALASAIVSALSEAPMSVNVKGEIDGKTLVNFIENNATAVGTAQAKGTSKI